MSSPSREKGRAKRSRGSEEEFVLFLQGIPSHCRWQELKDLVRQTALHIRQAVVYDDPHGFPTGLGQIIVKNEDEAWRTYHRLSTNGWEGQSLVVTLARTSSPTRPIAGPTKSPPCAIPANYMAGYSTPPRVPGNMAIPPSPVSTEPVISTSPTHHGTEYGAVLSPMPISQQPFMPAFTDPVSHSIMAVPNSPALRSSFCDPIGFGVLPAYAMSPMMHQCIIANGVSLNDFNTHIPRKSLYIYNSPPPTYPRHLARRSILIQSLNPTTTEQVLRDFLQEAGPIQHCEVISADIGIDAKTSHYRTFARVTLRTAEEAKRAVTRYNNTVLMGFKIRVKIDRSISMPHMASYSLAPDHYSAYQSDLFAPKCGVDNLPPAPATKSLDSDLNEKRQGHPNSQREETEACSNPKPKPIDRCQPLVVNGSGTGRRAAVAI